MIEEYISRLQEENRKKLSSYDKEMQELSQELSVNEKLLSKLEKEKQDDKNIFSPRVQDSGTDLEIQKAEDQIHLLKQRLESVGQMVETEVKNRDEYQKLADEAAKDTANKENPENKAAEREDTGRKTSRNETRENEILDQKAVQNKTSEYQDLINFLNSVCKKVDFSISLLNGNKNRCRSELNNIERMIRSYEDGLQETENS